MHVPLPSEVLTLLILAAVAWLFLVPYGLYERGTKR